MLKQKMPLETDTTTLNQTPASVKKILQLLACAVASSPGGTLAQ